MTISDEMLRRERQAFMAGAEWRYRWWEGSGDLSKEVARRYPHPEIALAPSGKYYRLVPTQWGLEIRAWDSEESALAGQCPYFVNVRKGDERFVGDLLNRWHADA